MSALDRIRAPRNFRRPTMSSNLLMKAALLAAALVFNTAAHAQLFRAYLAPNGADTNPCTVNAPCRLLPAALTAVADGGEIWMLGSANYNTSTVNVTKSVTILAVPGVLGSVVATGGGNAMEVAAPGVKLTLRNLVIVPTATTPGPSGVVMTQGSALTVENCVFASLANRAILVATPATVRVSGSLFRGNQIAIHFSDGATGEVANVEVLGSSSFGVVAYGNVAATTTVVAVSDTVFQGNGSNAGVGAVATLAGAEARVSVTRSNLTSHGYGISAQAPAGAASVTVSRSFFAGNSSWFLQETAGVVRSLGDNHVDDSSSTGTLTTIATR